MQLSTLARSRFLPRYGYQLVPHHSNEADESGSSKMIGFLSSRRFRVVLLVAILLVLAIFLMYGGPHLPSVTLTASPTATPPARPYKIDWSRFAYVQYITNSAYLCNSVMIFESLKRLGSKAQRVMMYPEDWNPTGDSQEGRLLTKAKEKYDAHLIPIQVQHSSDQEATWIESFTKLLAFNQTQYDRVISLDSDATVLQASHASDARLLKLTIQGHGRAVLSPSLPNRHAKGLLVESEGPRTLFPANGRSAIGA